MAVEPSILKSTKVQLDVSPDDPSFDGSIIGYLNAVFPDLLDLGIGPSEGFFIEDEGAEWDEFIGISEQAGRIKNLVFQKVRLMWDPPQNAFLLDSLNKVIEEATWRIVNKLDGDLYVIESAEELILDGGTP